MAVFLNCKMKLWQLFSDLKIRKKQDVTISKIDMKNYSRLKFSVKIKTEKSVAPPVTSSLWLYCLVTGSKVFKKQLADTFKQDLKSLKFSVKIKGEENLTALVTSRVKIYDLF